VSMVFLLFPRNLEFLDVWEVCLGQISKVSHGLLGGREEKERSGLDCKERKSSSDKGPLIVKFHAMGETGTVRGHHYGRIFSSQCGLCWLKHGRQ